MMTISYLEFFLIVLVSRIAEGCIIHLAKRFARWQDPARLR